MITSEEDMAKISRFAQRRAAMVRRAGGAVPESYAKELVHDALADAHVGVLRSDPRRKPVDQVRNAIKRRTTAESRRARRARLVPLPAQADEGHPAQESESRVLLALTASAVYRELCALVARDIDARAVLGSWVAGSEGKSEIMRSTGLSHPAYLNACRRLRQAILGLPPDLRDAALDLARA